MPCSRPELINSFRNKLISALVATAGVKLEGNEGAASRIWGSRLCPALEPLEDGWILPIPPQNLYPVPKTWQFRANLKLGKSPLERGEFWGHSG